MVTVQHVRKGRFTRYIGRTWAEFSASEFGNPFHVGKDGDRTEVILKFAAYWYAPEQKHLREKALHFAPDEILGCWCHPKYPECHGDIIAGYVNWKRQQWQASLFR